MKIRYSKGYPGLLALLPLMLCAAEPKPNKLYFTERGKVSDKAAGSVYERQYEVVGATAKVRDFYYPSMKKYADPYEIPVSEVKTFIPNLQNGTLTLWYANGVKKMTGSYRYGKPHGEWTNWYPNGKKSAVMPYVNGKTEGLGLRFYRSGQKESEIRFRNNKASGLRKQWYPNGKPKSESIIHNDEVTSMVTWDENGRLISELSIIDGMRSGIVLEWYPDGRKKSESVYQDDELVNKTEWDEEGDELQ